MASQLLCNRWSYIQRPFFVCRAVQRHQSSRSGGSGSGRVGRSEPTYPAQKSFNRGRRTRDGNFDEEILQPAARGMLSKKHDSGIPRLAARKHKAHLKPKGEEERRLKFSPGEWEQSADEASIVSFRQSGGPATRESNVNDEANDGAGYKSSALFDDDKYFWREEEYEIISAADTNDLANDDGVFEFEYEEDDVLGEGKGKESSLTTLDGDEDELSDSEYGAREGAKLQPWEQSDPEYRFFFGQHDVLEVAQMSEDQEYDASEDMHDFVLPLRSHGPEIDDFVEAMTEHPTNFARVERIQLHPDSKREPLPVFPKGRVQPSSDFVESYGRYLYVSGLPPLEVNGERGDLLNPIHRGMLQKTIARIVGVDSPAVFPASASSGFVGFESPLALAAAVKKGPSERILYKAPSIDMIEHTRQIEGFARDRTVVLRGVPPGNTAISLAELLFPRGSELGTVYGDVQANDFRFVSSTEVLLQFKSQAQAESAITSHLVADRLKQVGKYNIRYFRARRELVHDGFTGPNKDMEKRRMGHRLIVDGDMPSKHLYLSHAETVQLRNLDPSLSKEEISQIFQPFCAQRRDIEGSVEFVTCDAGMKTGYAYVGFDVHGEASRAMLATGGQLNIGDRVARLKLVRDRRVRGQPRRRFPSSRSERSQNELLEVLNDWTRYVDENDLNELEKAGISRVVLNDAIRSIRFNNPSFGALDTAHRSEAIEPQKQSGELYKELVQMYISTLKDCVATPDNVGELYEAIHFPNEDIDLTIFDNELERQQKMLSDRFLPKSNTVS